MNESDALRDLLIAFFELPPTSATNDLTQASIAKLDSLAMVQLITEVQSAFEVEFDIDEIERLKSYAEIRERWRARKSGFSLSHLLNERNLFRTVQPKLGPVLVRRRFPWAAARRDRGYRHMIQAWSSGHFQYGQAVDV